MMAFFAIKYSCKRSHGSRITPTLGHTHQTYDARNIWQHKWETFAHFSVSISLGWVHVIEYMEFACMDDGIPLSGIICKLRDWGSVLLLWLTLMYVPHPLGFSLTSDTDSIDNTVQVQFHLRLTTFCLKYEHVFQISAHILISCWSFVTQITVLAGAWGF